MTVNQFNLLFLLLNLRMCALLVGKKKDKDDDSSDLLVLDCDVLKLYVIIMT